MMHSNVTKDLHEALWHGYLRVIPYVAAEWSGKETVVQDLLVALIFMVMVACPAFIASAPGTTDEPEN
jgi:hypothetical protein